MKILVFEYITGGGLAGKALPASLMQEGRMMLQALVDDLKNLPGIQMMLTVDDRCTELSIPAQAQVHWIAQHDNIDRILPELITQADLVWPIAPETDQILAGIALQVVELQKTLLLSDPATVLLCSDKLATFHHLVAHQIPVVETALLHEITEPILSHCVLKPQDGVGCEGNRVILQPQIKQDIIRQLNNPKKYLIQPLLSGRALSLSCLFKQGRGWLLCCNQQQLILDSQGFSLQACLVNHQTEHNFHYQRLIDQIGVAIPGLWGYIGIDIIESTESGLVVIEINPRLTTSYVGIKRATGINVADQVMNLLTGDPCVIHAHELRVNIVIH